MHIRKVKIFRRRKRAVVRTIDFLVSFTLFIILLTQFFLIIINMNLNLASTSVTQDNPAELLANKFLSSTGTKNWGNASGNPVDFGLASDNSHSNLYQYLDLAKLGRLNGELKYLNNNQYTYINSSTVLSSLVGPQGTTQFRISTRPVIQVLSTDSFNPTTSVSTISLKTLTWNNASIANVDFNIYYVSLSTGDVFNLNTPISGTTNYNGQNTTTYTLGSDNYVAVIFAHSQDSWGISWNQIRNIANTNINSTGISSFLLDDPTFNSNSIQQITSGNSNINTTSAYYSSNNNNLTFLPVNVSHSNLINTTLTSVGTNAPFIQVYTMVSGTNYYYRVVTEPLVFNNFNYITPQLTSFASSQYPVYQTTNFQYSSNIYTYSTIVMTDRGPLLFTVELSGS